ncbi:MAG: anti-sigma factor family protein [Acidothermaceae bacterium]
MMAGGCADARLSLGAYVLGALDPAERSRVDVHLAECAECRDELASFAGLPGLLGRVSIAEVELVPEPPAPELLDRLLRAVGNERRRSRRMRSLSAAAAAVVVVAAGTVAGVAITSHHSPQTPTQTAASTTFTHTDPVTHITASVVEWPKKWGSALQVEVATGQINAYGDGHIDKCQLVAVGADGTKDVAASWSASGTSKVVAEGATSLQASAITAFDIVASDGSTLVSIPAQAASS